MKTLQDIVFTIHMDWEESDVHDGVELKLARLGIALSARNTDAAEKEVAKEIRRLVTYYQSTFPDLLSEEEMHQKGQLFATVDLAESGLIPGITGFTTILGKLIDGAFVVEDDTYEVEPFAECPDPESGALRFARLVADNAGCPVGPVVSMESPLAPEPDKIWAEWEAKLAKEEADAIEAENEEIVLRGIRDEPSAFCSATNRND